MKQQRITSSTAMTTPESFADVWRSSAWLALPIIGVGTLLAATFVVTNTASTAANKIGEDCGAACPHAASGDVDTGAEGEEKTLPPLRDTLSAEQFAMEIEAELKRARAELQPLMASDESSPCADPANCPEVASCQITVQVTDENNDVKDAYLSLSHVDHRGRIATWDAVTGADGAHRFSDLPAGEYHLTVRADGHALQAGPPYFCSGDGARAFFNLVVTPTFVPFEGRLLGHLKNVPQGASVILEQPNGAVSSMLGVAHLLVDAEGRFSANLAPGRYRLVAKAPHHQSQFRDFEIRANEKRATTKLKLVWKPEASGVVKDKNGAAMAGVKVYLGPIYSPKVGYTAVVTDAEGRFTLPLIPGQNHTITAHDDVGGIATTRVKLNRITKTLSGLQLVMGRGRTVGGTVLRANGSPLVMGDVRYRIKELGIQGLTKTDAEGEFVLHHAPRYDVEMWPEGGALGAFGGAAATRSRPAVLLRYQKPAY